MKNQYYVIPQGRKEFIRAYLRESSCSPANRGYDVLYHTISIATDHPEYNVQQMFQEYAAHVSQGQDPGWRQPYNLARYCFVNSITSARSLYDFIKTAAVEISDMEEGVVIV